jgi:hypothetical protein
MPPQWIALFTDEFEEIPLPTLDGVNFAVLKLKSNSLRTRQTEC